MQVTHIDILLSREVPTLFEIERLISAHSYFIGKMVEFSLKRAIMRRAKKEKNLLTKNSLAHKELQE